MSRRARGGGPHPGLVAAVSLALLVASVAAVAALSGGTTIPSPFGGTTRVVDVFVTHPGAIRLAGMLQLGSAIPLGVCAATLHARLRRLGVTVPGPGIGLVGGTAATTLLLVSGCITWTQAQPEVSGQPALLHALSYLAFASGGIAHVMGLGLLVAGTAVPGLVLRLLPAPLAVAGLVVAVLAELSFLTMVAEPLQLLVPIGRFGCLAWLVAAGFRLPTRRVRRTPTEEPIAST